MTKCLCTGMIYDPAEKREEKKKKTSALDKLLQRFA